MMNIVMMMMMMMMMLMTIKRIDYDADDEGADDDIADYEGKSDLAFCFAQSGSSNHLELQNTTSEVSSSFVIIIIIINIIKGKMMMTC